MRIAKLVAAAVFTLAIGSAVFAQEDFDLDALLNDIEVDSATAPADEAIPAFDDSAAMADDPAAEPMKGGDDLLEELLGDGSQAGQDAASAVDTDILDMLETEAGGAEVAALIGDVAEAADENAAMAEGAAEDMAGDLDDLLGDTEETADAMADDAGVVAEELMGEIETGVELQMEAVEEEIEEIAAESEPAPMVDSLAAAQELSAAEIVRLRAHELDGQEQMKMGFDALSDGRYSDAAGNFDAALRMIPARDVNQDDLASARWGLAEANTKLGEELYKGGDFDGAMNAADDALAMVPNHRGAARLKRRTGDKIEAGVYQPVRDREEVVNTKKGIQQLLREGRDYFENQLYDEAAQLFEQARLIDEYNVEAMQFLRRIEDRRYKLANLERERTVAAMMEEVRDGWNPPMRRDIVPPDLIKPSSEVPTADEGREELVAKMSRLIIPSIQFRDANILDVVEELRIQSEKADPEGLGVNIVLKLQGAAAPAGGGVANPATPFAAPTDFGNDPFFGEGFGDGGGAGAGRGFDQSGFGGGFNENTFAAPTPLESATTGGGVPSLTLTLRRISLLEALKIITEYADLKFKIENRIVFITPRSTLTDPLETRVYPVQPSLLRVIITSAEEDTGGGNRDEFVEMGTRQTTTRVNALEFFANAGVPFPPGTTIFYNEAISQLVVRNTIENLEIFERLLPKFNVPPPQVEIEARFVEILQEDLQELGLEWILTDNYEIASNTSQGGLGNRERVQIDANENGITTGLRFISSGATGTEAATRAGGGDAGFLGNMLSFSSVLTNPEINVVLHAIEQKGGSDLLSAPRIVTRSGVNATIQVVQEIIYPTEFEAESATSRIDVQDATNADISTGIVIFPETFETREVGVILNVTPTVGPDNYTIDLSLSPEVAELVDWIQYGTPPFNIPQPIFASRNATTSIVIWDGQTVAMGGLINEDLLTFEDKIPFLGDIPLIGRLFRSKGERSVKRNLLIFVSARIVDPAGRPVNQSRAVGDGLVSEDPLLP